MSYSLLLPALAMGFLGSPHCLGMCGGIVAAFGISIQHLSPTKRALLIGSYHAGRILSYMGLGLVATFFGSELLTPLLTDNALPRIILGLAVVFAALLLLGLPIATRLEKLGMGLWHALAPLRKQVLPMNSIPKALVAGLLWGLLPCGLVYGALVMAVAASTQSASGAGTLVMLAFGLGTLPMLLLTGTALDWLQHKVRSFNLRKFSGVIMLISGLTIMLSPTAMHLMHGHGHGHEHHHQTHGHGHEHHEPQSDHTHHHSHHH